MALSGTIAARQLATLGLSLSDIAGALNTTDDAAKAAFQDLDVSARVEAIDTALQKYQGVAEAVAQGVLGQFQNLKTQTEFVFESIGEAIAPAAEAFMAFASNVVLPGVQSIANAYKDWSGSITDLLGTLTTASTELVNTAINAAGVGQTVEETGAIVSQVAQNSFLDAFIPGLRLATAGIQELNLGIQVLANVTPGADSMVQAMTTHLNQMASAAAMGGDAFKGAFALSVAQATGSLLALSSGAESVVDHVALLNKNISDGKAVLEELKTASDGSAASLQAITAQSASVATAQKALATALGDTTKAAKDQKDSWDALVTTTNTQATAYTTAQDTFDALASAYEAGLTTLNGLAVNLQTVTEAQTNLTKAFQAYTGMTAQWVDSTSAVAAAVTAEVNKFITLQNAVAQTTAVLNALQNSFNNNVVVPGTAVIATLGMVEGAYTKVQAAVAALDKATSADGATTEQVTGIQSTLNTVLVNGQAVAVGTAKAFSDVASAADSAGAAQTSFAGAVADGTTKVGDLTISANAASVSLDGEGAAAAKDTVAVVANASATDTATTAKKNHKGASVDLATQLQNEDQAWANGLIVMQNYAGVLVSETTAATDAASANENLGNQVKQMASDMQDVGEVSNAYADSLLKIAADADDAADAVENLNTQVSKSGKGGTGAGGSGGGVSLSEYLSEAMAIASDPALGGALGGGGVNSGQVDQMAQELADATGQVVTTLDGVFIPAVQQAATEATYQALVASNASATTAANTTAVTANTTATVAATVALTAAQSSFIDTATAGDAIVTSFADLPSTIQDYLDSLNGTLVAYDDTTGALQFTTTAADGLVSTFNSAVAANELLTPATTTAAAAMTSVATAATSTGTAIAGLAAVASTATTAVAAAAVAITAAATAQSSAVEFSNSPLSNALYAGLGSSAGALGAMGAGQAGTPLNSYSNPNPGMQESPTGSPYSGNGVNLVVNVTGNSVTSQALVEQLANKVGSAIITNLRTLGNLKN